MSATCTLRLGLYRRLSTFETDAEIDAFGAELVDRFGPLPSEVGQLLKIMAIKVPVPSRQRREGRGRPEGHHRRLPGQFLRQSARPRRLRHRAGLLREAASGHEDRLHPRRRGSRRAHQGDGRNPPQPRPHRREEGGVAKGAPPANGFRNFGKRGRKAAAGQWPTARASRGFSLRARSGEATRARRCRRRSG